MQGTVALFDGQACRQAKFAVADGWLAARDAAEMLSGRWLEGAILAHGPLDPADRLALLAAGRSAGLPLDEAMSAPQAAALALAHDAPEEPTLLVGVLVDGWLDIVGLGQAADGPVVRCATAEACGDDPAESARRLVLACLAEANWEAPHPTRAAILGRGAPEMTPVTDAWRRTLARPVATPYDVAGTIARGAALAAKTRIIA